MIRNEYFTGSDGYNSLPIYITLMQYNDNWNVPTYTYNHNIVETSTPANIVARSSGTIGGSSTMDPQFQFTFDCVHEIIRRQDLADPFLSINSQLENNNFPTFSRDELRDEFIILSIPDVGQESKTFGYRDFVPQVWYNGRKIWQIYIGLIRNYTSKTAYILIPKIGTNLWGANAAPSNTSGFYIRCVWKNNIEDFKKEAHDIIAYLKPTEDQIQYASKNVVSMFWKDDHYEMTASIPTFIGLDLLDWYDIYYVESAAKQFHLLNARSFFTMEFAREDLVSKQGDYYREAFFREYFYKYSDPEEDYLGKTRLVTIKAYLKKSNGEVMLRFRPRSNTYDCFYFTVPASGVKSFEELPFTIEKNADILVFKRNGTKVSNIGVTEDGSGLSGLSPSEQYEIIPEYTSMRKYEYAFDEYSFTNTSIGETLAHRILYTNGVSPWNIENPEILVFNGDGEIVTNSEMPSNGIIDIYSNYDLGDTTVPETISGYTATRDFYPSLSNSEYYTLVSSVLSKANEDNGSVQSAAFPLLVEDYKNKDLIDEQKKIVDNTELKVHRVMGNKEYLFVDTPNTSGINDFRISMDNLLASDSDDLEVTVDEDLDNLKYALWSMFCATADRSTLGTSLNGLETIYNTIPMSIESSKDSSYDIAAYVAINDKITGSNYIIIPCDKSITASYIALLKERTYSGNQKYLSVENVSLVKRVEYGEDRCALVYVAPSSLSTDDYKYLYIPNWVSYNGNKIYTMVHSNS